MPQTPKPEAKRRHVTTACISCRESKIKFLLIRSRLSLRVAVELLSNRVNQLCHFINQNGLQPPPVPPDEDKSLTRILDTLGLSKVQVTLDTTAVLPVDPALVLDTQAGASDSDALNSMLTPGQLPVVDSASFGTHVSTEGPASSPWNQLQEVASRRIAEWNWSSPAPDYVVTTGGHVSGIHAPSHPLLSSYTEGPPSDNDSDSGSTEEDLVNQLSDRLGSLQIGPNGRIAYYGPTSNFSLVEMPAGSDSLAVDRTVRDDGQEHLNSLGYGKKIPPDLEDHLINLYFAWQDPFSHMVDRTLYEEAKMKWFEREEDTPYYSEALRNAMCSLGATFETKYHPSFVTFPKSLSDFFAARAKTLLEIELDSPSVSTVQAMVVLSSHEIGANRDSRGWLYSGMALRLAFDLALHKDMTSFIAKGILTPAEAELRRAVFWGTFAVDQTLGYYRGRPFRISMDDITVQKPGGELPDTPLTRWLPYTFPVNSQPSPISLDDHIESVSRWRIELCEIMAPLGDTLYGNSKIPKRILQENNERVVTQLFTWRDRLPECLRVNPDDTKGSYLPHVLLLHMQYFQNVIHSHRPWMSSSYLQPQPPRGPGNMHAQHMCIESATAIAKLIQIYERQYSLKRVNVQGVSVIFSASIMLIFASMSRHRRNRTAETATHLSVCFRALDALSSSWECAKRSRDFLLTLQRKWELRSRKMFQNARKVGAATPASGYVAQGDGARKRARTNSPSGSRSASSYQSISPARSGGRRGDDHEGIDMDMRLDLDWVFAAGAQSVPANWDNLIPPDAMFFNHHPTE
ncbi:Nitrogen assimilation transcription factor nit-4 [Colletotrichum spinosum]|uniref:Nitrogen assimilation transcription factor nit-4 n=1 Tax=Colletotrichum spinosum TaxID=1347390 RepID=A0A4R8QPY4_9PEZI|nr:Nitrogen assimilation transcription factor nit-4 [Colletotrichum spinosum]